MVIDKTGTRSIKKELYHLQEDELWQMLKKGSREALERLFYIHHSDLFRYAVRFSGSEQIAEDQIQALFLKIWERRGHLSNVVSVKTYLWTALRRNIIFYQKKRGREREAVAEKADQVPVIYFSAEEIVIQKEWEKEKVSLLYKAIHALNPRQKEILYLKYFEGMSYNEIEQITSLNYQTIRNYIYESVKVLKTTLKKENREGMHVEIGSVLFIASALGFWM